MHSKLASNIHPRNGNAILPFYLKRSKDFSSILLPPTSQFPFDWFVTLNS